MRVDSWKLNVPGVRLVAAKVRESAKVRVAEGMSERAAKVRESGTNNDSGSIRAFLWAW